MHYISPASPLVFYIFFVVSLPKPGASKIIPLHWGGSLSANVHPYVAEMMKPGSTLDAFIAATNARTAQRCRIFQVPGK